MTISRRGFILGLGAALAAPAIVRAEIIMPVRKLILSPTLGEPFQLMVPRAPTFEEFSRRLVIEISKSYGLPYEQIATGWVK